jgi:hypothetical protein
VSNLSYLGAFVRVQSRASKIVVCLCANTPFEKIPIFLLDLHCHGFKSVFLDFESRSGLKDLILDRNLMDMRNDSIDYRQIMPLPMQASLR